MGASTCGVFISKAIIIKVPPRSLAMEKAFPESYLGVFPSHSSTEAGRGSSGNLRDRLGKKPPGHTVLSSYPLCSAQQLGSSDGTPCLTEGRKAKEIVWFQMWTQARKGEGRGCTEGGGASSLRTLQH